MKILVTGSSGTIGTRLCEKLIESGVEVAGADWQPNKWQNKVQDITVDVDLRDQDAFEKLPADIDFIVHFAANARVYDLVKNPELARDNFLTTFNVLEFARQKNVPRILFASSRECYGNDYSAEVFTEDMARIENCESPYTASKIGGEALMQAYRRCYGLKTLIVRFSNVYGMYDDSNRVVPLFIRRAKDGEPLAVFGQDKCLDFTYIDDAVAAVISLLQDFDCLNGEVYNIATGTGTTIMHMAERIKELLSSNSKIVIGESRTGEVIRYIADYGKIKKAVGYEPGVLFEEGIEKAVNWYNNEMI